MPPDFVFLGILAVIVVGFLIASIRLLRADERRHCELMQSSEEALLRWLAERQTGKKR